MKSVYFFIVMFIPVIVITTGCNKEDTEPVGNSIEIRILEPVADEVVGDAKNVHLHIEIEATEENHEVEILLHPSADLLEKVLDYDEHNHDMLVTFEQDVDLSSYPAGTAFMLEVAACLDHDCENKESAAVEFFIP